MFIFQNMKIVHVYNKLAMALRLWWDNGHCTPV